MKAYKSWKIFAIIIRTGTSSVKEALFSEAIQF